MYFESFFCLIFAPFSINTIQIRGGPRSNGLNVAWTPSGDLSQYYMRLELTWGAVVPAGTGGMVTLNYHVVLPEPFVNTFKTPAPSLFEVTIDIGGSQVCGC